MGVIHCITNQVAIADTANMIASCYHNPVMTFNPKEIKELKNVSDGFIINLGMLTKKKQKAICIALKNDRKNVVLDCVGVHLFKGRREFANRLIKGKAIDVVKGNFSEIGAMVGIRIESSGLECIATEIEYTKIIDSYAIKHNVCICVTGKRDYITNGYMSEFIYGGNERIVLIPAIGCTLGAMIVCSMIDNNEPFEATKNALVIYKEASLLAFESKDKTLVECKQIFYSKIERIYNEKKETLLYNS